MPLEVLKGLQWISVGLCQRFGYFTCLESRLTAVHYPRFYSSPQLIRLILGQVYVRSMGFKNVRLKCLVGIVSNTNLRCSRSVWSAIRWLVVDGFAGQITYIRVWSYSDSLDASHIIVCPSFMNLRFSLHCVSLLGRVSRHILYAVSN